jgi:hypothetical protein
MSILVPASFLPPLSYISECFEHDKIWIEAFETYQKQTIRNHCRICGPNGVQQLTLPVTKVNGNHTLTKDIRISYFEDWQKIHWRSIETAYNNSPFFLYYRDYFEPFFLKKYDFLIDYNFRLMETIFIILRLEKEMELTEQFEKAPEFVKDKRKELGGKQMEHKHSLPRYTQVFEERHGFIPNLSIIDLIFNLGPEAQGYFL